MNELKKKAITKRVKDNRRMLNHYHYARKLGFSSAEATLIMCRSIENIERAAREEGYIE